MINRGGRGGGVDRRTTAAIAHVYFRRHQIKRRQTAALALTTFRNSAETISLLQRFNVRVCREEAVDAFKMDDLEIPQSEQKKCYKN
ncbi:hypothetical protein EVAR_93703_1 [Eumeta japonica]|uniref:Uncharacterized protein n=1 Tax=Eumeta variegata TaxID=151549 RepID=A0A4C1U2T3_EUMVA|nr:hypothetical protein EVAR_93703_1 [Eumeta japonica]